MGLTKQYLRYSAAGVFNYLASARSNIAIVQGQSESKGKRSGTPCVCFACSEIIYVWDVRRNEKVLQFSSVFEDVTCLEFSRDEKLLAAGYADGSVAVYNLLTEQLMFSQKRHKSSVTCLAFNREGSFLASGAKDTETVLWDVIGQTVVCSFKGHKSPITDCHFMQHHPYLVTSSKDSLLKIWDLQSFRCCSTLVGHKSEVCKFVLLNKDERLITGSADSEVRVYDLSFVDTQIKSETVTAGIDENKHDVITSALEEAEEASPVKWKFVGSLVRTSKERIISMVMDTTTSYLCFHGADSWVETLRINSEEKVKELMDRRIKKKRKKMKTGQEDTVAAGEEEEEVISATDLLELQIVKISSVKCNGKIGSMAFLKRSGPAPSVLVSLANAFVVFSLDIASNAMVETMRVSLPAHKFDIRTAAITSDGNTIMTTCSESLRVWNKEAAQSIHCLPCDYAVSSALVPGDRYLVLGSKSGKLELFDIIQGSLQESLLAHEGPVWGLCICHQTKKSLITGGEDKDVKFWDLEFGVQDSEKKMTLVCRKTLKMDEGITSVRLSPDQRLLAVALLDNTVKVFFADSLKFFLSLYGHALPVTCVDISSDSRLIITGSADKNVKIWGLDFGDCHKSLYAHDDSVTNVVFVSRTHLFFSAGRDGRIKQWDADKFERITTLIGHHSEVWALALTPDGTTLVSTSHDRSVRVWEKTDEILVLEEERENEREKEHEEQMNQTEEPVIPGETNKEIGAAAWKTLHALQAAEKIIESLSIFREEDEKITANVNGEPHALLKALGNISPTEYVLTVLQRVKPSELQGALLALPLNDAVDLVRILEKMLLKSSQTELLIKCLTFLLRINALQIESNRLLLPELDDLRSHGTERVDSLRNLVGFNLAALENLRQQIDEREDVKLFSDATQQFAEKKKKQKNRAILSK